MRQQQQRCATCSENLRAGAKFCHKCGATVASPVTAEQSEIAASLPTVPAYGAAEDIAESSVTNTVLPARPAGMCPVCWFQNAAGASMCERCSAKMWLFDDSSVDSSGGLQEVEEQKRATHLAHAVAAGSLAVRDATALGAAPTHAGWTSPCPRCGELNGDAWTICASCGLPFDRRSEDGVPVAVAQYGHPAGFWIRFVAWFLDFLIVFGIGAVIWPVLFQETFWITETTRSVDGDYVGSFVRTPNWLLPMLLLYDIFFHAFWGATPGKKLLNIRLYDARGQHRIGMVRAEVRTFGEFLSGIPLLLGYILTGARGDRRSLHDLIAGTYPTIKTRDH